MLIQQLSQVAPKEVVTILSERIHSLAESNSVGLLTVGGLGAVWAASGGVVALMTALNTTYGVEESRPFWKVRGIALLVTLGAAVVSIIAAAVAVAAPAVADKLGGPFSTLIVWLRLPFAGMMMMLVWAVIYYALPDVKQKFKFITPGSVVGVLIWVIASWGFSKYVANFGKYDVNYGAIGGVIVFLLWMWITAQVILLGAEINAILEHRSPEGKSPGHKVPGKGGVLATKTEVEQGGVQLPGATDFLPPPAPQPGPQPSLRELASGGGGEVGRRALAWASSCCGGAPGRTEPGGTGDALNPHPGPLPKGEGDWGGLAAWADVRVRRVLVQELREGPVVVEHLLALPLSDQMRVATSEISSWSCVTTMTVPSNFLRPSASALIDSRSRWLVGSSSTSTLSCVSISLHEQQPHRLATGQGVGGLHPLLAREEHPAQHPGDLLVGELDVDVAQPLERRWCPCGSSPWWSCGR